MKEHPPHRFSLLKAVHVVAEWSWFPGLMAVGLLLLVYAGTLHSSVYGCSDNYMDDVGEIQIALNVWGTVHFTGYPLYTILGAVLAAVGRAVGLTPAAAASASSTLWSLLGLLVLYRIVWRLTRGERAIAALTVLAVGLIETFWVHSVIAEVYSFSALLMCLMWLVALRLAEVWDPKEWYVLVALLGAGAAHHRLLVLVIPGVLFLVLPALWEHLLSRPVRWVYAVIAFLLPFVFYLYLPLRSWQGSMWVYGNPGTWSGFWAEFVGQEALVRLRVPPNVEGWIANLSAFRDHLGRQLPLPVFSLLLGVGGLGWLTYKEWRTGLALLGTTVAFLAFVLLFPTTVWVPSTLMPALLLLAVGAACLLCRLVAWWSWGRWLGWAGLIVLSLSLFRTNLPLVWDRVCDPFGGEVIQTLALLRETEIPGGRSVVALPWGGTYFAAGYGLYVTGELGGFELVDHRADFRSIVDREDKILTLAFNLGRWPLYWWEERLGEAHFSGAAPGVAAISRKELYQQVPLQVGFDLGNGVRVRSAEARWMRSDAIQVSVYWEAMRAVEANYSVAVHLLARDPPQGPQDLLAQADAVHPVSGWYPVSRWQAGEVVRDEYVLRVPAGGRPVAVRIGMYQIDGTGTFVNSPWLVLTAKER